ncbi:hypothetical protein [Puerhibacterium puerhi]|uniref:hypothetical protein n=1 Tax=Puerhibacterium puerhi TaxID=2692623 RepID=UPI00135CF061|nr:hypothetical protein [Puerhibacterium puerhi]
MAKEDSGPKSDVWANNVVTAAKEAYKKNRPPKLTNEQRVHLKTLLGAANE